jgi:hypothetical protein
MSKLKVVRRHKGLNGLLARYRVIVDGVQYGMLWAGASVEIDIPEGQHTLEVTVNRNYSTGLIDLSVHDTSHYLIECYPSMGVIDQTRRAVNGELYHDGYLNYKVTESSS